MPGHAYGRVALGLPMSGVIHLPQRAPVGWAIDELHTILSTLTSTELEDRVIRLHWR